MPATTLLFENNCKPKFIFGKNHRNLILFSPFPKYLLLAGFGNLGGDMEIWDMDRLKSIGKCNVIVKKNFTIYLLYSLILQVIVNGHLMERKY